MTESAKCDRVWSFGLYGLLIYIVTNGVCIGLSFIPGKVTFLTWSYILPAIAIVVVWLWLYASRRSLSVWWLLAFFLSVCIIGCALLTRMLIFAMWAAV